MVVLRECAHLCGRVAGVEAKDLQMCIRDSHIYFCVMVLTVDSPFCFFAAAPHGSATFIHYNCTAYVAKCQVKILYICPCGEKRSDKKLILSFLSLRYIYFADISVLEHRGGVGYRFFVCFHAVFIDLGFVLFAVSQAAGAAYAAADRCV